MRQKFSLEAAGKLLGIGANSVRARAKKNPDLYQVERDNSGKIWVWIDPENLQGLKASKATSLNVTIGDLKASIDALRVQADLVEQAALLRENLAAIEAECGGLRDKLAAFEARAAADAARADAAERARDVAEAQAEAWRALADKLAARRRWWPFG